jgi:flagellar motility protein MotE (MotC chaperone)
MNRTRLLPILLFGLVSLLGLKGIDLLGRTGYEVGGPAPAFAGGQPEPFGRALFAPRTPDDITGSASKRKTEEEQPVAAEEEATDAAEPGKPVETVEPLIPLASGSPSERAILERLQQRREELARQASELDMRENLLEAAEQRIAARIAELKALEATLGTAQREKEEATAQRMRSLVIMYEAMKPKDAARIFDRLDIGILVDVTTAMKPAKVADVLAAMDSDAAKRLTVALADRAMPRSPPGKVPPPAEPVPDLPKIEGQPTD